MVWRVACVVRRCGLWWLVVACGCGVRRRVAAAKASARQGQRGHEPGRLLSLAATLMLLARRSTEDPPERREARTSLVPSKITLLMSPNFQF